MKAKKVMALVLCAAMVSGLAATTVMAAPEDQFEGLTAIQHRDQTVSPISLTRLT